MTKEESRLELFRLRGSQLPCMRSRRRGPTGDNDGTKNLESSTKGLSRGRGRRYLRARLCGSLFIRPPWPAKCLPRLTPYRATGKGMHSETGTFVHMAESRLLFLESTIFLQPAALFSSPFQPIPPNPTSFPSDFSCFPLRLRVVPLLSPLPSPSPLSTTSVHPPCRAPPALLSPQLRSPRRRRRSLLSLPSSPSLSLRPKTSRSPLSLFRRRQRLLLLIRVLARLRTRTLSSGSRARRKTLTTGLRDISEFHFRTEGGCSAAVNRWRCGVGAERREGKALGYGAVTGGNWSR